MEFRLANKESKDCITKLVETGEFDKILQQMFITDKFKDQSVQLKTVVVKPHQGIVCIDYVDLPIG